MRLWLRRFWQIIQQENLLQLTALIAGIVFASALLISWLEAELSFSDGLWWSIVTLTTVGYGDISPATLGGRLLAVLIMVFGIGLLGTFCASLAALLVGIKLKENKGMCLITTSDHIIICEWNHRTKAIIKELRADIKTVTTPIVLVAELEEKPFSDTDAHLFFVRGPADEETLTTANLKEARTIIVLGDDRLEPTARDAKVVLTTLTIEDLNSATYIIVELVDQANKRHCLRAKADEIIISSELSSHLIASSASDHGISRIVNELLSSSYGNELYTMPLPAHMEGKSFLDIFFFMKSEHNATLVGLQQGRSGAFIPNPEPKVIVNKDDLLVVISQDRITG